MEEILVFLSLFIALAIMLVFAFLFEKKRLERIIKQYNKENLHDLKDFKKTTIKDINKQFLEWQISMFAKNSDGFSQWEKFKEWDGV